MLSRLRWQLSLLYMGAAVALIVLIGAGAYGLLSYYFGYSTDLALQYKVALEYEMAGQPIPADLQAACQAWQASHPFPPVTPAVTPRDHEDGKEEDKSDDEKPSHESEESYDSELASIFLLPIDARGQLISASNVYGLSIRPDSQAIAAAVATGRDLRTVRQGDGSRVRLFTYRVSWGDNLAVLQVGRSIDDQSRLLQQLLAGLAVLGGVCVLGMGAASWWLAGRSLLPAQRAWDRQQTFVANASHELRTPLTLLRASAEVARRGLEDTDPRSELLSDILGETDHMSRLVADLLLLSRLDAGHLKLDCQPVDVGDLLQDLAREMGRVAEEHAVTLQLGPLQGLALADAVRLRQVILVLLDNALHYTPAGGTIRLEVHAEGRRLRVQVSDTGSGIPEEHLPHIFERFYRGNEAGRRPGSGNGLGLAIARGLVEAMHGQINIANLPSGGTQASLSLPVPPHPAG